MSKKTLDSVLPLMEKMEQELVISVAHRLADGAKETQLILRQIREESARLDLFKPDSKEYSEIAFNLRLLENKMMSATTEWRFGQLSEIGKLNNENIDIIAKYSGKTTKEIHEMLNSEGIEFVQSGEQIFNNAYKAGAVTKKAVNITMSIGIAKTLEAGIRNADNVMNLVNTKALESAKDAFMDAVNMAYLETVTGTKAFDAAVRDSIERMAKEGITGATYKSRNKIINYSLDAAVRMNLSTTVNNTMRELQFSRMDDWGCDLIEVSSHAGARPGCAPYQGRIYSRSGKNKEYPALRGTSYGKPDGLFGINCKHTFFPFFPGLSKPRFSHDPAADMGEDNDELYKESQRQRKLERDVREQKRVYLAGKAANDKELMTKASIKLKDREKRFTEFLNETGRRRYAERQRVAGFGKKEAGEARRLNNFTQQFHNVKIKLPNGSDGKLYKSTIITDVEVFAGKGSKSPLRVKEFLVDKYGGDADKWVHVKGRGYIDVEGKPKKAMIHWFQEDTIGIKEAKVKGWSKK